MAKTFWTREFYKPKGAVRVAFKNVPGGEAFYVQLPNGKYWAKGFKGRAQKPFFNYTFRSYEGMTKYVTQQFAALEVRSETKAREKEVLRQVTPKVKVGDIFSSSWGYEQTNVYFYQVVGLKGTKTVLLRRIAGERKYDGAMSGAMTAVKNAFIGDEILQKRAQVTDKTGRVHFKMESYEYAYPWNGEPMRFSEWH